MIAGRRSNPRPVRAALPALLALVLLTFFTPVPALAAEPATFSNNSAVASFPESITFQTTIESDVEIQQVELYWRPVASEVLSLAVPDVSPGTRIDVEHEIDMTINYLPPGLDIVWFWRVTAADGTISESPPATVLYMDTRHEWRTLTDGLVTLYWYRGDDDFAEDIVATANRTIDVLANRFQVTGEEGIRLVIYGNNSDFAEALPPNSAEWIGGQAYSDLKLIIASLAPDAGATAEIRRMVPHEVSHLIVHQATLNPFNSPQAWLDEGLAVYNQETPDVRFASILDDAVAEGRLIPVRALNSAFPLDPDDALLSYAESESIVRFIIDRWGDDGIAALLGGFRDELSYDDIVQHALGVSVDELDAQWKAWLGYTGDTPPDTDNTPDQEEEFDPSSTEGQVVIGLGIGLVACLSIVGILAFYMAYKSSRPRSPGN